MLLFHDGLTPTHHPDLLQIAHQTDPMLFVSKLLLALVLDCYFPLGREALVEFQAEKVCRSVLVYGAPRFRTDVLRVTFRIMLGSWTQGGTWNCMQKIDALGARKIPCICRTWLKDAGALSTWFVIRYVSSTIHFHGKEVTTISRERKSIVAYLRDQIIDSIAV